MYKKYVELRDKNGVTDYRVAEDTKIPRSTFSEWKSGRSNPKVDKLLKIAEYFGVSIEYFLKE
jgi:transcriptional regulator with XRE-family HTH domain